MTQLTLDLNIPEVLIKNKINFGSNFYLVEVYDRMTKSNVSAHQYKENFNANDAVVVLNLIQNNTFVPHEHVYFDTINDFTVGSSEKLTGEIVINCYIDSSSGLLVSDIHRNLRTILVNYYLSGSILRKIPSSDMSDNTWLSFDPSVNMFAMRIDFVFKVESDYNNVPECRYRTSPIGASTSTDYKYANKSTSNICSNESVQVDNSGVTICPWIEPKQITKCPYYEPDIHKIVSLELVSKQHESVQDWKNTGVVSKLITAYLIREIIGESYVILFIEEDLKTKKTNVIKKLQYQFLPFNNDERRNVLIQEAYENILTLLMDYSSDYAHKLTKHIEDSTQLKKSTKTTAKVSYLSTLRQY